MKIESSKFIVIKSVIIVLFAGAFIGYALYAFLSPLAGYIGVGLFLVFGIYTFITEWMFAVEVKDGTFYVYSGTKVKYEFVLADCAMRARTKSGGNNIGTDCSLEVEDADRLITVDCTPLGNRRFQRLLDDLGFNDHESEVLETQKKGD